MPVFVLFVFSQSSLLMIWIFSVCGHEYPDETSASFVTLRVRPELWLVSERWLFLTKNMAGGKCCHTIVHPLVVCYMAAVLRVFIGHHSHSWFFAMIWFVWDTLCYYHLEDVRHFIICTRFFLITCICTRHPFFSMPLWQNVYVS